MQILIYGFQRSGTTLLRRLLSVHPEIKRMVHEQAVLKRLKPNPRMLPIYLKNLGIDMKKDIWGEKVPYYTTAKAVNPVEYCKLWLSTFKKKGRIVHIIRHPYDTAFSILKKYKRPKRIEAPLGIYKKVVPRVLKFLDGNKHVLNIKYEDLLMNPDETMHLIYEFCGVDPTIDYKSRIRKLKNKKYQAINPDRAFAYKKQKFEAKVDLKEVIDLLNEIDGVKYNI